MSLYEEFKEYGASDYYPYHMPGHKRIANEYLPESFASIDFTEVEGLDNLHEPSGIIRKAQDYCADVCGAKKSYFLVGGSTAGVLAAVSAALKKGDTLLMVRNAHKSAYHGAILRDLKVRYIFPDTNIEYGFCEAVTPKQVKAGLEKYPEVKAVFIVSPTYEGRIAEVSKIAQIVHEKGIPLIVDEAHGAHLSYANDIEAYPQSAVRCGADIVIQSTHKTLPAPTQTAILHVSGDLIDINVLERFLKIYQSSSPSYPLMAGIDGAVRKMAKDGKTLLNRLSERFEDLTEYINANCRFIKALPAKLGVQDMGKLIISAYDAGLSGKELADILRNEFHLETEMSSERYVLAMFTVCDGDEAYDRMKQALKKIDSKCGNAEIKEEEKADLQFEPEQVLTLSGSFEAESFLTELDLSEGLVSADFVSLYPPGTPLLVPGERISSSAVGLIKKYIAEGLNIIGADDNKIRVHRKEK